MAVTADFLGSWQWSMVILIVLGVYLVKIALYRLYFSPLAKFPGPKLAAFTFWVEIYHDVLRCGKYTFEIAKMHKKYGPIVRITPEELHIDDPTYSDELYPGSHKVTDKPKWEGGAFGNSRSLISAIPHDLHKRRRSPLNPFFSKRSVNEYAGSIQTCVDRLCAGLEGFQRDPVNILDAYSALAFDVITLYCFGRSYDSLGKPNFDPQLSRGILAGGKLRMILKHYPWIFAVMINLPSSIVARLNPDASYMIKRRMEIEDHVHELISRDSKSDKSADQTPTIFRELLDHDAPADEKSMTRLVDEGMVLIGAGTVTTSHVLGTITYHLLVNPELLLILQEELEGVRSDGADLSAEALLVRLEHLPYLTATIAEGLRIGHGVVHRLERVAPDRALKYKEWIIPPKTATGMTPAIFHVDPTFFPAPLEFRPERWLQDDIGPSKRVFMPFGKGTRMCLGLNLAYAELYLTLAAVLQRFDLQLFETTRADIDVVHDFVAGKPRLDSKGVRVLVHRRGCGA